MADEQDTREVLFPQWMGPDKHGLTIEQKGQGEIFVKEVKDESPAAHTGNVYEGDQIVGATIYFDNMSSEETAELLKTLNQHKVGLKLQNKTGDKSPCRSPMGTLSWEGRGGLGGSSSDIFLSGDDEDYKRIYTKKIKPRLKSEDLAEGVDVCTERHSSTSSDGCTITTITRRITTYTVDVPGGTSQQIDHSSPEFKIQVLQHEQSEGDTTQIRLPHSSLVSGVHGGIKMGDISLSGPHMTGSSVKHCSTGSSKTTSELDGSGKEMTSNVSDTGLSGGKGQWGIKHFQRTEASAGSSEHSGKVTMGLGKDVKNIYSPSMMGVTELSTVKDSHVSGFSISGDTGDSIGRESLYKFHKDGSDDKTKLSKVTIDVQRPKESPNVEVNFNNQNLKDVSQRGFSITGNQEISAQEPDTVVSLSKADVKITPPDMNIRGLELKIEGYKGMVKDVKFDVPSNTAQRISMPDVDLNLKGQKAKGDLSAPNVEGVKGDFTVPKVKIPSFGIKTSEMKGPDVDANLAKVKMEIKTQDVDMNTPGLNIVRSEGKVKDPKIKMPPISGPKISVSDMNLNVKGSTLKDDINVSTPKVEGDVKAPKIEGPELQGTDGGFKIPKIKMPSFGIHASNVEGPDVDVNLPKADMKIKSPELDINGCEGKINGSKFKMSMPDVDLNLKGPKLKGDVDVSVPKVEGDIKAPKAEIERPDIEGPEIGFKMPKSKMPSFGMKGPKVDLKGPKLKGDLDVSIPKVEGDLKAPKVEIEGPDIERPDDRFKMPKFHMPSFGMKGPKVEGPDVDVKVTKADIEVKAPDVDINAPELDIDLPEGKIKGPKVKMPSVSGPEGLNVEVNFPETKVKKPKFKMPNFGFKGSKIEGPDVDFKHPKGPKVKGQAGVSLEGDVFMPKLEVDSSSVEVKSPEGGFKMPKFKMPKFGFKSPNEEIDVSVPCGDVGLNSPDIDIKTCDLKVEGPEGRIKGTKFKMPSISGTNISLPDVDLNLKSPKVKSDIDVSGPKISGYIKAPKMDIECPDVDVEGPEGSFKMPKMKMPLFGFKGPKLEGPDIDINLPKANVDIKGTEIDIKTPDLDIEGPEGKIKGAKFNMPSISGPKISMPDVNLNLKGPKFKGDMDVYVPQYSGDIKAPKVGIDGSDVDIEGPEGGFKMPKIKMPSFGLKGPKLEGPDVDIKTPDFDIEGPEGKIKGPKFNMPSISGPKISMPDVNLNLKSPKVKGDLDFSVPKISEDIKAPKVDIEGPDINLEGPEGDFKMTSFGLKGPNVEGPDVDISLPKADVDIKGPEIDVKAPDIDIEGPDGGLKHVRPLKFTGPNLGIKPSGGNLLMPEKDLGASIDVKSPYVNISGTDANIKVPKMKKSKFSLGVKSPKLDADIPDSGGSAEGPDIDVKENKGKFKLSKGKGKSKTFDGDIKLETNEPDLQMKSTKVKKPLFGKLHFPDVEFDIKSPKVKGSSSASGTIKSNVDLPSASLKTDIQTPDAGFSGPNFQTKGEKIKMLNLGISGSEIKTPELDVRDVSLDLPEKSFNSQDVSVAGSGINGKSRANIDIEGKIQDVRLTVPAVNVHGGALDADLNLTEQKGVKGSIEIPGFNVRGQKGETTCGLDVKPDASLSGVMEYQDVNVTFPKIKVPKFGVALPKVGSGELAAGSKVSSQSLEMENTDMKSSGGKVKVKMPKLFTKSKSKGGSAGDLTVEGEEIDVTSKGGAKVSNEFSLSSGELTSGKLAVEGSSGFKVTPKSKSASLDLLKRKPLHSSSVSDEGGLASPVSAKGHLQTEGGNVSVDVGEKVKGKKGKFKFATVGGFSSKSKGSYEVTDESEVRMEGVGGVAQSSKKSRMSSSSSNDSGSKSSFRLPRLEIAVSPKK